MAIASLVIAVIAILVSATALWAARTQNKLSASAVSSDWLRDIRAWATEAIGVLAEATYTCKRGDASPSAEEAACILRCRHRLSALVDSGRLLLPNERQTEGLDTHKPSAYRGLRHPALDALVAADSIMNGELPLCAFPDRKAALIGLRREFVSLMHSIIDPASFNQDIARILSLASKTRAVDPSLGGLLPDASKEPPNGADGILQAASRRFEAGLSQPSRR